MLHAGAADSVIFNDPYMVAPHHLDNLSQLVSSLVTATQVRKLQLITHTRSQVSGERLQGIVRWAKGLGITMAFSFLPDLHLREVAFSNGILVVMDRGSD